MKYNPSKGGHAPGELRGAFGEWVDGVWDSATEIGGKQRSIDWLVGQLWNCTDVLGAAYCSELDMPAGSTFAQAARHVMKTKVVKE